MKGDAATMNLLAMLADSDARATASLVEMLATAAVVKLKPPKGKAVVELVISQDDLNAATRDFFAEASYDDAGTMTLRVTRLDTD